MPRYTLEQLDNMTPEERLQIERSTPIADLSLLSPEFRDRVIAKGQRIAEELKRPDSTRDQKVSCHSRRYYDV